MHGFSTRDRAPIELVIIFVGAVLLITVLGIVGLAAFGQAIPEVLGTVCIASMTGLVGLLTPNMGAITQSASERRKAAIAGQAAAAAVIEHDGLTELGHEAAQLRGD